MTPENKPDRRPSLPGWAEKVVGWVLLTILTLYTSSEVSKAKIDTLQTQQNKHEAMQLEQTKDQMTRREFDQFKEDLVQRLDRMENKLDRIQDSERQHNK